jgi:hypothetical protein
MSKKSKIPFICNVIITLKPANSCLLLISFSFCRRKSTSKRVAYAFEDLKNAPNVKKRLFYRAFHGFMAPSNRSKLRRPVGTVPFLKPTPGTLCRANFQCRSATWTCLNRQNFELPLFIGRFARIESPAVWSLPSPTCRTRRSGSWYVDRENVRLSFCWCVKPAESRRSGCISPFRFRLRMN